MAPRTQEAEPINSNPMPMGIHGKSKGLASIVGELRLVRANLLNDL